MRTFSNRQPTQLPQIAPIWRRFGLASCILPSLGHGFDLIDGKFQSFTGTAPVRRSGRGGFGSRFGNTTGSAYLSLTNTPASSVTEGTIIWFGERHASGAAVYRDDGGAGAGNILWDDGGNRFQVRVNGTTVASVGSFPADTPVCTVLTGDASGAELWVNGALVTTISGVWAWRSSSVALQMHNNGGPGNFNIQGIDATDYLIGLFSKKLPRAAAAALSANPWLLFTPESRTFGFSTGNDASAPAASFAWGWEFAGGAASVTANPSAPAAAFAWSWAFTGGAASVGGTDANAPAAAFVWESALAGGAASVTANPSAPGAALAWSWTFSGGAASVPGTGTLPQVVLYIGGNMGIGTDGRPVAVLFI